MGLKAGGPEFESQHLGKELDIAACACDPSTGGRVLRTLWLASLASSSVREACPKATRAESNRGRHLTSCFGLCMGMLGHVHAYTHVYATNTIHTCTP